MEIIMNGVSWVFEKAGDGFAWLAGKLGEGVVWGVEKAGEGVVWGLKEGLELIGAGAVALIKELSGCSVVFTIVGVIGMFIVMTGRKELGTKLTSGSVIGYIFCKAVAAYVES